LQYGTPPVEVSLTANTPKQLPCAYAIMARHSAHSEHAFEAFAQIDPARATGAVAVSAWPLCGVLLSRAARGQPRRCAGADWSSSEFAHSARIRAE